jgi:hypothetical protein
MRTVNNNYNSNTVVKQDFAVVKQVDGRAAHMTGTTRHQSWQSTPPPPYQIMLDPSLLPILPMAEIYVGTPWLQKTFRSEKYLNN